MEPPHTRPNFVMREMGCRIARKHAHRLRDLAMLLAFARLAAASPLTPLARAGFAAALLAALSMVVALPVERRLFFAEAEHVVMLYYGADGA